MTIPSIYNLERTVTDGLDRVRPAFEGLLRIEVLVDVFGQWWEIDGGIFHRPGPERRVGLLKLNLHGQLVDLDHPARVLHVVRGVFLPRLGSLDLGVRVTGTENEVGWVDRHLVAHEHVIGCDGLAVVPLHGGIDVEPIDAAGLDLVPPVRYPRIPPFRKLGRPAVAPPISIPEM